MITIVCGSRWRAGLLVLAAVLCGITSAAAQDNGCRAQNFCPCDHATITVNPGLNCAIEFCEYTLDGIECFTVGAGQSEVIKCERLNRIIIRDCRGNRICPPTPDHPVRCVCAREGCCVDLFMDHDDSGCLVLRVEPAVCRGC